MAQKAIAHGAPMEDEYDFRPRLGRLRAPGPRRGRRYLRSVLVAAARQAAPASGSARFTGSRLGRGAVNGRLLGAGGRGPARRGIVKTRLVRLGGQRGGMRAHLRYLQRDAAARDGSPGRLYDGLHEGIDDRGFLGRSDGDRHQFRIIVSAEDGHLYEDLKPLVRRFMARMEEDLGTRLDWVAVDHADTLHPHSHIVLRGRDDEGRDLVIAPEYIRHGMRARLGELVSLDLGPRTRLEVEAQRRREVEAERFTPLDRRLLRERDPEGRVSAGGRGLGETALKSGRLRKLERLGMAVRGPGGQWTLPADLEPRLRALGERGDIIRTMQRALARAGADRPLADRQVHEAVPEGLVGRVLARGLADELQDRHYLLVDGIDGRTHYVPIGEGGAVEPLALGAIVRIGPAAAGVRAADRRIAWVAAQSGGHYSAALHGAHEPDAGADFIAAHVRRLEAMRRPLRLERDGEGRWTIGPDHLQAVARYERMIARRRPARIDLLSPLPLERLPGHDGATWLDRQLAAGEGAALRDAGFGREVRGALAARRAWLIGQGLADEGADGFVLRRGAMAILRRRDIDAAAAEIARDTGKLVEEAAPGSRVEGVLRRRLDLASGRFALIEGEQGFSLVPWRRLFDRAIGQRVGGIIRERQANWTIGRGRGPER